MPRIFLKIIFICMLFISCATQQKINIPDEKEGHTVGFESIDSNTFTMPSTTGYLDGDNFYIPSPPSGVSQATIQSLPSGWDFIPSTDLEGYYLMIGTLVDGASAWPINDSTIVSEGDTISLNFSWSQPPTFDKDNSEKPLIISGNWDIETIFVPNTSLSYVSPDSINYEKNMLLNEGVYFFSVAAKYPGRERSMFSDPCVHKFVFSKTVPPSQPVYLRINVTF